MTNTDSPRYGSDYLAQVGPELDYALESGAGRTYRYLDERKSAQCVQVRLRALLLAIQVLATHRRHGRVSRPRGGRRGGEHRGRRRRRRGAALRVSTRGGRGGGSKRYSPGQARRLEFRVVEEQQKTTGSLGNRSLVPGMYTVSVGGHQSGDRKGEAESNTVAAEYTVR